MLIFPKEEHYIIVNAIIRMYKYLMIKCLISKFKNKFTKGVNLYKQGFNKWEKVDMGNKSESINND